MFFWRKKKVEPPLSIWISVNINNYVGLCESLAPTEVHASVPVEERERIGLADGLIRISVGIENVDDLIEDLKQAFKVL